MKNVISVIIPTFQRGDIIDRALNSVFAQRGIGDWIIEAIVVDDGSSDETEAAISSFAPPEPHRLIYHKVEHIGRPGLVRNIGLDLSHGELIGYCDSDDIWLPHHLATCLRQLELYPDAVMVETWWSFQQLYKGFRRWQINFASSTTDGRTTTTNSRIHRRAVLAKVGRFDELPWGEDIDLWTRIGFAGPVRRVKMPTTVHSYTRGGNNVTFAFRPDIGLKYDAQPPEATGVVPLNRPMPQTAAPEAPRQATKILKAAVAAEPVREVAVTAVPHTASQPSGRRLRRRISYAVEHPKAATLILGQRTLPVWIKRNAIVRRIGRRVLRLPLN